MSRNERDHTKRFGGLVAALAAMKAKTFTLDGEVAVFDRELVSRFEWLRLTNHGDVATPPLTWRSISVPRGPRLPRGALKVRRRALEKLSKGQTLILPPGA